MERGFRFGRGEIDIIAYDGPVLVFIEVKSRTEPGHGLPEEAVTPGKRRQLRRIAIGYLAKHAELFDVPCRFDVVAVEFGDGGHPPLLRHFRNAF